MLNQYQLRAFFIMSALWFLLGSFISMIFFPIDIWIGYSIGFILLMTITMLMIKRIMSEKNTEESLSSQEGIE